MILTKEIEITISSNGKYYRNLGYGRCKQRDRIMVKVEDLPINCNKLVKVQCDCCNNSFERGLQLLNRASSHLCYKCARKEVGNKNRGNKWGFSSRNMSGENHPRWNPNKTEFNAYAYRVRRISESQDLASLSNSDKPRGLCGEDGAYQLDHIISIKEGFDKGISPEIIGDISNLQFIHWKENRNKGYK